MIRASGSGCTWLPEGAELGAGGGLAGGGLVGVSPGAGLAGGGLVGKICGNIPGIVGNEEGNTTGHGIVNGVNGAGAASGGAGIGAAGGAVATMCRGGDGGEGGAGSTARWVVVFARAAAGGSAINGGSSSGARSQALTTSVNTVA
jgi:hypothetical protein